MRQPLVILNDFDYNGKMLVCFARLLSSAIHKLERVISYLKHAFRPFCTEASRSEEGPSHREARNKCSKENVTE